MKRITSKRGVNAVVEHADAATWPASLASIARNGRLITCNTTGHDVPMDLRFLFSR